MRHATCFASAAALLAAGLLAAGATAAAPKTQPNAAARAVQDFVGKLRDAFPLGMWQGRFTEVDKDGNARVISDDTQCLELKDREDLIAEITDPMLQFASSGKCTHESSGSGALVLGLRCTSSTGKILTIRTTGTYSPEGMQFQMRLTGEGPGSPPSFEFNAAGKRVGECPQAPAKPAPAKP